MHKELIEAIASNDETLMEKYFDKGELDEDEMKMGLKKAMINHDLFPLFCLSAERNMGSGRLMGFIDNVCPSANEMPPQKTKSGDKLTCDANGPACIFIYKTISVNRMWVKCLSLKCIQVRLEAGWNWRMKQPVFQKRSTSYSW